MGLGAHPGSEIVVGGPTSATLDVTGVQFEQLVPAYTVIHTWPCVASRCKRQIWGMAWVDEIN